MLLLVTNSVSEGFDHMSLILGGEAVIMGRVCTGGRVLGDIFIGTMTWKYSSIPQSLGVFACAIVHNTSVFLLLTIITRYTHTKCVAGQC